MLLDRTNPLPLCEWRMQYPPNRFPETWAVECPHCEHDDEIDDLLRRIFEEDDR